MKFLVLFLFPFYLLSQPLDVPNPLRFLALGDSYTIGQSVSYENNWPSQLADSLRQRDIVLDTLTNFATTGWQTNDLLKAVSNLQFEKYHYNLVSLLIGGNNVYRTTPVSQYLVEYKQLLDSAIRYAGGDTSHVFVVSIPDFSQTPFGQTKHPKALGKSIQDFNAVNKLFAEKYNIRYFDITPISAFGLFKPYLIAGDDLHPSEAQYSEWVKLLLTGSLQEVLRDLETKPMILYSNPVMDKLTIKYPLKLAKTVEVLDCLGRIIHQQQMHGEEIDLYLKDLDQGFYIIRIRYKGEQISKRIIKQ